MGENRSNVCLGLSGVVVKFAFMSLLLSSVCFPTSVFAEDSGGKVLINDGTELRNALLQGLSVIELSAAGSENSGFTIPNPGQEFIQKIHDPEYDYSGAHRSWLTSENYNLTFMGNVSFQNAYYSQQNPGKDNKWITDFTGSVINNGGNLTFSGINASFVGNKVFAKTDGLVDFPGKEGAAIVVRGTVYNKSNFSTEKDTALLFKDNEVVLGSRGVKDGAIVYYSAEGLGAGLHNAGVADIKGNASFVGNTLENLWGDVSSQSENMGAGLYNSDSITFHKTAFFEGNKAQHAFNNRGGGLYNSGRDYVNSSNAGNPEIKVPTIHFKGDAVFNNNETISDGYYAYGGGAHNMKGKLVFDNAAVFTNNKTTLLNMDYGRVSAGAGLYSLGEHSVVDFNGEVRFEGNHAISKGEQSSGNGAGIYLSEGKMNFNKGATFKNNQITADVGFSYAEGGAIQVIGKEAQLTFNDGASFENNKIVGSTFAVGGALTNYANVEFNGDSAINFKWNEVKNLIAENTYTNEELKRNNVHFIQARGGALYNAEGNIHFAKGTTVTFEGNKALSENATAYGGAVYNDVFANDTGRVTFSGDVHFENNVATTGGGAIFNKGVMALDGTSVFEGNTAKLGGAIYNDMDAQMTISGSQVSFKNNHADLGSNIYNLGSVTIQNVHDTMAIEYAPYTEKSYPDGGHTLFDQSGDVYNAGTLNIVDSTLQLHTGINTKQSTGKKVGSVSLTKSTVDLGLGTVYTRDFDINHGTKVITHVGDNKNGQVIAGNSISISNANTELQVIVDVDEIKKGEAKEYQIFKVEKDANTPATADETEASTSHVEGEFSSLANNHLYTITATDTKGVYKVERGSSTTVKPANPNCPSGDCDNYNKYASDSWIDGGAIEGNADAQRVRSALHDLAQVKGFNSQDYQDAINAITPDTSSLITSHANEVTRQISNAISKRFYDSMERSHYVYNGKIHYKAPRQTSNVWVEGIYGQSEYSGKNKWDMDTMGLAAGIEAKLTKELKVGAMVSYTTTDGGPTSRDTEIETTAGAVYAEYSPSRFYTNAFALYGTSKVKEKRSVFSTKVESEFDVNIVAAQAIAGYKLGPVVFGNWVSGVISPEAGFRYVYAKQKEYTDTLGQTVEGADSHTLTGILGARYTVGYKLNPNMWIYPELRAALTYDFITPTMDTNVVLLNGANYAYETEEMDRFGVEIGLKMGLELDKRTEIGLEYEGLFKGDYTNHTGIANMKYHF